MNCKKTQRLLSPYLDGELESETQSSVRQHLSNCPDCSLYYEELKTIDGDVTSLADTAGEVPETFTENLLNTARRQSNASEDRSTALTAKNATTVSLGILTLTIGLIAGTYLGFGFIDVVKNQSTQPPGGSIAETNTLTDSTTAESVKVVSFNDAYVELAGTRAGGSTQ